MSYYIKFTRLAKTIKLVSSAKASGLQNLQNEATKLHTALENADITSRRAYFSLLKACLLLKESSPLLSDKTLASLLEAHENDVFFAYFTLPSEYPWYTPVIYPTIKKFYEEELENSKESDERLENLNESDYEQLLKGAQEALKELEKEASTILSLNVTLAKSYSQLFMKGELDSSSQKICQNLLLLYFTQMIRLEDCERAIYPFSVKNYLLYKINGDDIFDLIQNFRQASFNSALKKDALDYFLIEISYFYALYPQQRPALKEFLVKFTDLIEKTETFSAGKHFLTLEAKEINEELVSQKLNALTEEEIALRRNQIQNQVTDLSLEIIQVSEKLRETLLNMTSLFQTNEIDRLRSVFALLTMLEGAALEGTVLLILFSPLYFPVNFALLPTTFLLVVTGLVLTAAIEGVFLLKLGYHLFTTPSPTERKYVFFRTTEETISSYKNEAQKDTLLEEESAENKSTNKNN